MLPLLPTLAHNDLAGSLARTPRTSDPDRFFTADASLTPDPLFMALRSLIDRITGRLHRSETETAIYPPKAPTGMPVIEHPACRAESSDRIAA